MRGGSARNSVSNVVESRRGPLCLTPKVGDDTGLVIDVRDVGSVATVACIERDILKVMLPNPNGAEIGVVRLRHVKSKKQVLLMRTQHETRSLTIWTSDLSVLPDGPKEGWILERTTAERGVERIYAGSGLAVTVPTNRLEERWRLTVGRNSTLRISPRARIATLLGARGARGATGLQFEVRVPDVDESWSKGWAATNMKVGGSTIACEVIPTPEPDRFLISCDTEALLSLARVGDVKIHLVHHLLRKPLMVDAELMLDLPLVVEYGELRVVVRDRRGEADLGLGAIGRNLQLGAADNG